MALPWQTVLRIWDMFLCEGMISSFSLLHASYSLLPKYPKNFVGDKSIQIFSLKTM